MQKSTKQILLFTFAFIILITIAFRPWEAKAESKPWPLNIMQLGVMGKENTAAQEKEIAPFGLRYHYLSSGVNTGDNWQTWGEGKGTFVDNFIVDSYANNMIPIFSDYQIRQSLPGKNIEDEQEAVKTNLQNPVTMKAYFEDLKTFFVHAKSERPVILQVEPDMWGYSQKEYGDNACATPAIINTTLAELKNQKNNLCGLAKSIIVLRNKYAPNVLIGYSLSIWGTNKDIVYSNETISAVEKLANRSADFYKTLNTTFDVVFSEFSDRDSGYAQNVDGKNPNNVWWDKTDYQRHTKFMSVFHDRVDLPIVLWQIPLGNTIMDSMNNTPGHYQDNKVQTIFASKQLKAYKNAGVVALLFGSGQADGTNVGDSKQDGITNPAPITGNTRKATSPDDDGGYFRLKARNYYKTPVKLK